MDTYGKVNTFTGESSFIPFRYQGQYEDTETGLYYNRFRYYDCNDGRYISQDPIGLASGEFGFYNYVEDSNGWIDVFGLAKGGAYGKVRKDNKGGEVHHMPANSVSNFTRYSGPSIWMTKKDHRKTRSWGNSNKAKLYRAKQKKLIKQKKFSKAMEMDIKDLKQQFGDKYNSSIKEMLDYSHEKGMINKSEFNALKNLI